MIAAVETYLALRRRAGFTLSNTECLLRSFARFARDHEESVIRTTTVLAWATQGPSLAQRHRRYKTVRRFAVHAQLDDPQHEAPPAHYFGYRTTRRPPRLFTPIEIGQLLAAAAQLTPRDSLRPHTYVALISLLAATGLRISEPLALQVADLSGDGLLIRKTKFQKTRLVPLHETAVVGLARVPATSGAPRVDKAVGLRLGVGSPARLSRRARRLSPTRDHGPVARWPRSRADAPRATPHVCGAGARGDPARPGTHRPIDARAGDVSRARQHRVHLLVSRSHAGVADRCGDRE